MTDNDIMPYGKYRGQKMANVPAYYLLWLHETGNCEERVKKYISDNLDALKAEVKREA